MLWKYILSSCIPWIKWNNWQIVKWSLIIIGRLTNYSWNKWKRTSSWRGNLHILNQQKSQKCSPVQSSSISFEASSMNNYFSYWKLAYKPRCLCKDCNFLDFFYGNSLILVQLPFVFSWKAAEWLSPLEFQKDTT